jgi:hypothetical protein
VEEGVNVVVDLSVDPDAVTVFFREIQMEPNKMGGARWVVAKGHHFPVWDL